MQINSDADLPLANEIYSSSDRAAVILCMAWVDEQLTSAIKAVLKDDPVEAEKLLGPNGPVGAFAAKCRLAALLGIIMKETAGDLKTMAVLRNSAAHVRDPFGFDQQTTIQRVSGLRIVDRLMVDQLRDDPEWLEHVQPPRPFDAVSARMHFIRCASFSASNLYQYASRADVRIAGVSLRPFF